MYRQRRDGASIYALSIAVAAVAASLESKLARSARPLAEIGKHTDCTAGRRRVSERAGPINQSENNRYYDYCSRTDAERKKGGPDSLTHSIQVRRFWLSSGSGRTAEPAQS